MGLWAWLGRRRADEWLYRNRSQLALILGLAVVGQIIALVLGLTRLWIWPAGWLPPIKITDQVEALLATGTFALAFAALVQAVSGLEAAQSRIRPTLVLAALDLVDGPGGQGAQPGRTGRKLAVRNLGPGVARDVSLTYFSYPETAEAKKYVRDLRLQIPATGVLGLNRTFLDPGEDAWWNFDMESPFRIGMDFAVEIEAYDVFRRARYTRKYHVRRLLANDPIIVDKKIWLWWIMEPPDGDENKLPSVQQLIDRAHSSPAPYHWDV